MSDATVRLLQAAAEILGGEDALAKHLNIGDILMRAYLEQRRPLPDFLLLRAVDIVLEHVKRLPPDPKAAQVVQEAVRDLKMGTDPI